MDKLRKYTRFVLKPFSETEGVLTHDIMAKFGYYPDTEKYTGFYVKKVKLFKKSVLFIDLYGVYTVQGGILYNFTEEYEDELEFLKDDIQDLIDAGLVMELDYAATSTGEGLGKPMYCFQI